MIPGERTLEISGDAVGNVIIQGDHATITVIHTTRAIETVGAPPCAFGANPYKGLAAFQEKDADLFFGREELVRDLWDTLDEVCKPRHETGSTARLIAVLGRSGSGKSSLVRAGLLPELVRRPLPGLERLLVIPVIPGAYPIYALSSALAQVVAGTVTEEKIRWIAQDLETPNSHDEHDGLHRIAKESPILVFVDQFEEIYTSSSGDERRIFLSNLLQAAKAPDGMVSVLVTLRSDFLGHESGNDEFDKVLVHRKQTLHVLHLDEEGLRRAISEPARRAGHPLPQILIESLVREFDAKDGALPVLQFALSWMWEARSRGIPFEQVYDKAEGAAGALAKEAQRIYLRLNESEQAIARRAFLRMIRVGIDIEPTARKVDLEEITAHGEECNQTRKVLERFARPDARIVTLSTELDGLITAKLTHEILLEAWEQLDAWLTVQAKEDLIFHYRLEEMARYWHRKERREDLLWPKRDLGRLLDYKSRNDRDMTRVQMDFFKASSPRASLPPKLQQEKKLGITGLGLIYALLILFLITGIFDLIFDSLRPPDVAPQWLQIGLSGTAISPSFQPKESPSTLSPSVEPAHLEQKVRALIGVSSLEMSGSPMIAIIGDEPPGGILGPEQMTILGGGPTRGSRLMTYSSTYSGVLVRAARIVAPDAHFAFSPLEDFSTEGMIEALEQIREMEDRPAIVLVAYSAPPSKILDAYFERLSALGILVIYLAHKEGDLTIGADNLSLLVSAVDLEGNSLTPQRSSETIWAPGEVPSHMPNQGSIKGDGPASAIAAGIAARLLDREPELPPSQLIQLLRNTSRRVSATGPPVLNLDAAFAQLTERPPSLLTN